MRITALILAVSIVIGTAVRALPASANTDTSFANYMNGNYYSNLVSNENFLDHNSMSVADIQNFLVSKGSCLASVDPSLLGEGANGRSAAQIIYDAAHGLYPAAVGTSNNYGVSITINSSTKTVSPKVLLVTLQKEQSLITDPTKCVTDVLRKAMGYGCPTGGSCDAVYYGFSNQLGWGAWQFRLVYERSKLSKGPAIAGNLFSTTEYKLSSYSSCVSYASPLSTQSVPVYLTNHATASLYSYTPHRYCGNYNFWRLGVDWFGFGASSGGSASGINDTTSVTGQMYSGTFKIQSLKASDSEVVFNGAVIAGAGPTSWSYEFTPSIGTVNYTFSYRVSGSIVATKTATIERRKNGDINGDNRVDLLDLSLISDSWGTQVDVGDWRNLNPEKDSVVDLLDISIFANSWEG